MMCWSDIVNASELGQEVVSEEIQIFTAEWD